MKLPLHVMFIVRGYPVDKKLHVSAQESDHQALYRRKWNRLLRNNNNNNKSNNNNNNNILFRSVLFVRGLDL